MATSNFINRFAPIRILHIPRYGSNCTTVRIGLEFNNGRSNRRPRDLFCFEEAWTRDDKYKRYGEIILELNEKWGRKKVESNSRYQRNFQGV